MKYISKLGYIIIIIGIAFLFDWKIIFPLYDGNKIEKLSPSYICDEQCNLIISEKRDDVLINVYLLNEDIIYVSEFTKIIIVDKYYLSEINKYNVKDETIFSTIASIINNYPYNVDLINKRINIYDGKVKSNFIYSLFTIIFGILLVIKEKRYNFEENH